MADTARKPVEELLPAQQIELLRNPERELQIKMHAAEALIEQLREVAGADDEFLADLIEGQTDVFDILEKIAQAEFDEQILLTGISEHASKLAERRRRCEVRIQTQRSLIAATLNHLGVKSRRLGLGTFTVSPSPRTAIVTEESSIPSRFWKPQDPKIDKKALNEAVVSRAKAIEAALAIEDAESKTAALAQAEMAFPEIPGATISNGGIIISVRR